MLSLVNAQADSRADWRWRINVAHRFGHAAGGQTVRGTLTKLDREGIAGEFRVRDAQEGRAEVGGWGVGQRACSATSAAAEACR